MLHCLVIQSHAWTVLVSVKWLITIRFNPEPIQLFKIISEHVPSPIYKYWKNTTAQTTDGINKVPQNC